jgi:phosphoribosyl 1,2-cyclic phosphodiesterase
MKVTFWGTRGSLASPGPETVRYGGNTPCVEVRAQNGDLIILDGGTGIRRLGAALGDPRAQIDILLTHLHGDHVQGLGFFNPQLLPDGGIHIWGPRSINHPLSRRLSRILAPPLFPVHLRDMPGRLTVHELPQGAFGIGAFTITAALVCHPGPTVGYRIRADGATLCYLPDHEPALGSCKFPTDPAWTSGFDLAQGADVLIHDAQYTVDEYRARIGWGHSALPDAVAFAALCGARRLLAFHHDPSHDDDAIDRMLETASGLGQSCDVVGAREGMTLDVAPG